MTFFKCTAAAAMVAIASPALADFEQVTSRSEFVQLVSGKTLTRPLVRLRVGADGSISGRGATWDVSGQWQWKGNYLCRSLEWGGDDLGYNCQEIKVNGSTMRITSDRGAGQSADFRLR
ncbi:MAG: dihydrodipicolinate reductase [Pseudomonadota bacterium]